MRAPVIIVKYVDGQKLREYNYRYFHASLFFIFFNILLERLLFYYQIKDKL